MKHFHAFYAQVIDGYFFCRHYQHVWGANSIVESVWFNKKTLIDHLPIAFYVFHAMKHFQMIHSFGLFRCNSPTLCNYEFIIESFEMNLAHDAASDSRENVFKWLYFTCEVECVGGDYDITQYPLDIHRKRNHNHNGLMALIILF